MQELRLCLVTNILDTPISEYHIFVKQAVDGGVTMVQWREKGKDYQEIKARALALSNLLKPLAWNGISGMILII